ncbi:MAG: hypothetical protein ACRELB_25660, partial [Polyangiaceae bacterium]
MSGVEIAVVLFGAAALGGLVMAAMRFKEKAAPLGLALAHGAAAAAALVIVLVAVLRSGSTAGMTPIALALFVAAALGGFFLFSFRLRGKLFPVPVMLVHAGVAVAGF